MKKKSLGEYIEKISRPYIFKYYKSSINFARILRQYVQEHVKKNIGITLDTPFLSWTLVKYLITTTKFTWNYYNESTHSKHIHRFDIIKETDNMDISKMRKSFCPLFVQSLDAFILHYLYYNIHKLNKVLQNIGLPIIDFQANHDGYDIAAVFAILLKPLFKSALHSTPKVSDNIPPMKQLQENNIIFRKSLYDLENDHAIK